MRTILIRLMASLAGIWPVVLFAGEPIGMTEVYRLDRLPVFKNSVKIGAVTSYDRSGGNDDGFSGKYSFVRKDAEGVVLADLKGPGVIYRVWTPTPTDDLLEILFDGEDKPRVAVKYRDLFLGKHPAFPRPLVGFGAGGYWSYVPMPFERTCVVRLRAPKAQFYQINYALYGPETPMRTFSAESTSEEQADRVKAGELLGRPGADNSHYAGRPAAKIEVARTSASIPARGTQKLFEATQGGRLVGLRLGPVDRVAGKARDLLLKISFDGEPAAVLCPLGDFFGYAWGQPAMQSLLVGTYGATNYCYFPMPFDRSAVVEVVSERANPLELWAEVMHTANPRSTNEGKFYALWRRENPTRLGEPFTFLDTAGRGHLVGVVLQAQGFESGKTLFFEGDDQTTVDGELVIHGTGSEDFFNGGWYDVPDRWEKQISFPLSGCLGYAKHLGRTGAYRFFLGDAYSYRRSLRQTIEHAGNENNILTDYCAVSYFYSERPPVPPLELPRLSERAVRDPDEVLFPAWWQLPIYAWSFERATLARQREKIGQEDVRFLALTAIGNDMFGPHFLSPTCEVPATGNYAIYIEAVKGPGQATVQLFKNENPAGDPVDLYAAQPIRSERLLLGTLELNEGRNNLMFKLVGKNDQSSGLGLNLIQVVCVRQK